MHAFGRFTLAALGLKAFGFLALHAFGRFTLAFRFVPLRLGMGLQRGCRRIAGGCGQQICQMVKHLAPGSVLPGMQRRFVMLRVALACSGPRVVLLRVREIRGEFGEQIEHLPPSIGGTQRLHLGIATFVLGVKMRFRQEALHIFIIRLQRRHLGQQGFGMRPLLQDIRLRCLEPEITQHDWGGWRRRRRGRTRVQECRLEARHIGVTLIQKRAQSAVQRLRDVRGQRRVQLVRWPQRVGRRRHAGRNHRRRLPGQQMVKRRAQTVEVATLVGMLPFAPILLERRIFFGAHPTQCGVRTLGALFKQAKVHQFEQPRRGKANIGRLDVAVQNRLRLGVQIAQHIAKLDGIAHHLGLR